MSCSMQSPVRKDARKCSTELYTIGFQPLGCGFRVGEYKPSHRADEARSHCTEGVPIDVLLELNTFRMNIRWWVDVAPFDRWQDPDDLHIGEHTNHILAIMNSACFQYVMTQVKLGWKLFLRDGSADLCWAGLFFRSLWYVPVGVFCPHLSPLHMQNRL